MTRMKRDATGPDSSLFLAALPYEKVTEERCTTEAAAEVRVMILTGGFDPLPAT